MAEADRSSRYCRPVVRLRIGLTAGALTGRALLPRWQEGSSWPPGLTKPARQRAVQVIAAVANRRAARSHAAFGSWPGKARVGAAPAALWSRRDRDAKQAAAYLEQVGRVAGGVIAMAAGSLPTLMACSALLVAVSIGVTVSSGRLTA
jgi:hypothetical protein